ncbi:MAG: S8 family serine peptidase [Acidimicrobiaceae bacterium]|nr:S8 family serine peptidase [Acidimicrobiaceae bacterium]
MAIRVPWRAAVALVAFAVGAASVVAVPPADVASAYEAPEADEASLSKQAPEADEAPEADKAPESAEAPEADEASCGEVFTYWDGDAERTVVLCDEIPDDGDRDDPDDFRGGRGDPVGAGCASGASDGDGLLFQTESGAEMTLTHSVVLVLDPGWSDARVHRFLARNRISPSCASPLGWIANGFAIATGPGMAALALANQLAPQHGVVLSSPNWASEVEVKAESDPPTRLSAPTITAAYPSDQAITLTWEPPADVDDETSFTYDISWLPSDQADDPAAEWRVAREFDGSLTEVVIWDPLSNGTTYDVRIRAVAEEDGEWSESVSVELFERSAAPSEDAPAIPLGVTIGSVLDDTGLDVDLFKIELDEPQRLTLRTIGGPGYVRDTECRLLDSDGTLVPNTENDDVNLSESDRHCFVHANLASGTYWFEARGFALSGHPAGAWDRGRYLVRATIAPDPGTTADTALALPRETIFAGSFASREETQFWRFDLAESEFVDVFVDPLAGTVDLSLRDSSGERLDVESEPIVSCFIFCVQLGMRIRSELAQGTYYAVVESRSAQAVYAIERVIDQKYAQLMSLCLSLEQSTGVNDELQGCQWHLDNRAQRGGVRGEDANVVAAHAAGYLGAGVGVAVVDAGIDLDHEDLAGNTDSSRSRSYCGSDTAPFSNWEDHGTAVAGVIAARDNSIGMRGVAPRATVFNRRLICGGVSDEDVADSMTRDMASICVSNNSWSHIDNSQATPVSSLFDLAIDRGVSSGCGGKGINYIWSAGNGGTVHDDSNLDEYVNYYGAMTVCAVNASGVKSQYSESGANLWVCGPSNDYSSARQPGAATLTNHDRYRIDFGGTSSAAPVVAGVAALVRGANSELTWRDVKLILAASARQNHPGDSSWREGAVKWGETDERYQHSRKYGFGVVDAHAAVQLAEEWTNLPPMITQTQTSDDDALEIPDGAGSVSKSVTFDDAIEFVEFVQIDTSFKTWHFRDLQIELVSPSGTEVLVVPAGPPSLNSSNTPLNGSFRFGVAGLLGEPAEGTWTLKVTDTISGGQASLESWGITLYGHRLRPTAPTVTAVEVSSDAGDDAVYAFGEVISVRVTFSEAVDVTGAPTLGIDMDPADWGRKEAVYASGSGTAELVFAHEVVEPNFSTRGIAVLADTLALAGGTIRSASTQADAELAHAGLDHDPDHQVDWHQQPPDDDQQPPDDNGNRAPVFGGTAELTNTAPPGFLVSLTLWQSDFTDPDGDPLTFEISTSRDDVVAPDGISHNERFGRLFFEAKTACALLELGPEPGEVYETTVTMTATDPDGATAHATRTFRTDPTWNTSTASLQDACPQVTEAAVNGTTLVISLDAAVAMSIEPPTPAEFAVTADGAAVAVASVRRPGRYDTTITLELASPVTQGQTVTVSYAPGDYPITFAFADQPVANNTPAPVCVTAPEGVTAPTCAAVSGNDLIVAFSADLAPIDAATSFELRHAIFVDGPYYNGAPGGGPSAGRIAVDGAALTLTLGTAVQAGDEVTIHYSASAARNALRGIDGTPIPDFTLTVTTTAHS